MATIKDIIDGSTLEISKKKRSKTLIYIVTEVTGATSYAKEMNALGAAGVPGLTSKLGTMDCVSLSAKIEGPSEVHITIRYETGDGAPQADPENPELPTYEVGTQLQQYSTRFMPDGITPITVTYNEAQYKASVTVDASIYTLRVTRVESGILPGVIAKTLLGKVNSVPWQGGTVGTWRCVVADGSSPDAGLTWNMVYEFLYLDIGHQPNAVAGEAIDQATGELKSDAVDGNGSTLLEWYGSFNFNLLGL